MIEFEIKPIRAGKRSSRYAVLCNGEVVVQSTADPEHDSARVWLDLHPGDRDEQASWTMAGAATGISGTLGVIAAHACRDSDKRGLKIIKWSPYDGDND